MPFGRIWGCYGLMLKPSLGWIAMEFGHFPGAVRHDGQKQPFNPDYSKWQFGISHFWLNMPILTTIKPVGWRHPNIWYDKSEFVSHTPLPNEHDCSKLMDLHVLGQVGVFLLLTVACFMMDWSVMMRLWESWSLCNVWVRILNVKLVIWTNRFSPIPWAWSTLSWNMIVN